MIKEALLVLGIDPGGFSTCTAYYDETGRAKVLDHGGGKTTRDSCIFANEDGSVLIGDDARASAPLAPDRFIDGWKHALESGETLAGINGTDYTGQLVAQRIIEAERKAFIERYGARPTVLAVGAPNSSSNEFRKRMEQAGKAAGFERVLVFQEATAGLAGSGLDQSTKGKVLVVDVGGTTTDCTLSRVNGRDVRVLSTSGALLGGRDFTSVVEKLAREKLKGEGIEEVTDPADCRDLRWQARHAKHVLSSRQEAALQVVVKNRAVRLTITQDEYRRRARPLREQVSGLAVQCCKEAGISLDEVDHLIGVGGGCKDPAVREHIEKAFDKEVTLSCEPDHAVALGIAKLGKLQLEKEGHVVLAGEIELPGTVGSLQDILGRPLGVAGIRKTDPENLVIQVLVEKGALIPSTHERAFRTTGAFADQVEIIGLEGEQGSLIESCVELGRASLTGLQDKEGNEHPEVNVRFDVDENGIVKVSALEESSGRRVAFEINLEEAAGGE